MLDRQQDSILVTRALNRGITISPVHLDPVETLPEWLVNVAATCSPATIFTGIQGHIFLVPLTAAHNSISSFGIW